MSKFYSCDNEKCINENYTQPGQAAPVELHGVNHHPRSGGIMLPDSCCHKDFCSAKCFWQWAADQMKVTL